MGVGQNSASETTWGTRRGRVETLGPCSHREIFGNERRGTCIDGFRPSGDGGEGKDAAELSTLARTIASAGGRSVMTSVRMVGLFVRVMRS